MNAAPGKLDAFWKQNQQEARHTSHIFSNEHTSYYLLYCKETKLLSAICSRSMSVSLTSILLLIRI